ncbi:cyclodeaminase/cyclohydrolase family protein [bacterium]|nr:cyclodeaminase/cyclohydrolase family protein [bacterium]
MSLITKNVNEFLNELASSSPAPGGGSVSALAAALGTALVSMVSQLTIGKKKYAAVENEMKELLQASEKLRAEAAALIDRDTEAFNVVMNAFKLPQTNDAEKQHRAGTVEAATKQATLVPLDLMKLCAQTIRLSKLVAEKGNTNALSDAGVSMLLIQAGCRGAYYNVKINLSGITDANFVKEIGASAAAIMAEVDQTAREIQQRVEASFA